MGNLQTPDSIFSAHLLLKLFQTKIILINYTMKHLEFLMSEESKIYSYIFPKVYFVF